MHDKYKRMPTAQILVASQHNEWLTSVWQLKISVLVVLHAYSINNSISSAIIFRADLNDFDDTVLTITFQPDENNPINDISFSISINDDAINEAHEQDFVVILNVANSINPALVTFPRASSLCRIIDNDRKQETLHT